MVNTYAIIIGVSEYQTSDFFPLPAAKSDAEALAAALTNWGIPQSHVMLSSGHVSHEKNLELLKEIKEPFRLLFYFCGHGFRTEGSPPESHLLFSNSSLNLEELLEKIVLLNTTSTYLFIDACHLRLNLIFNPRLKEEIEGITSSQKSIFCLLSSGIFPSFEDIENNYGYFTRALIQAIAKIRQGDNSPSTLFRLIQKAMKSHTLPDPEMYNIGTHKIEFFPKLTSHLKGESLQRPEVVATIQDLLVHNPDKHIWITGEHQTLPSQLFLNSTPIIEVSKTLPTLPKKRSVFFSKAPLRYFTSSIEPFVEYELPPLTHNEIALLITNQDLQQVKEEMSAIYSCGFFLNKTLFVKCFDLNPKHLKLLEQLGLIYYSKGECHPHDLLIDIVESQKHPLDKKRTLVYLKKQLDQFPDHLLAAESLIHTLACFGYSLKDDAHLGHALETVCKSSLNARPTLLAASELYTKETASSLFLIQEFLKRGDLLLAKKLLKLSPKADMLHTHYLWRSGDFKGAIARSNKLIPKKTEAFLHRGIAHYYLGNKKEAIEDITYVYEKSQITSLKGWTQCLLGTITGSKKIIESGIQLLLKGNAPEEAWMGWNSLGELALKTEEYTQAAYYLDKAHKAAQKLPNPAIIIEVKRNLLKLELKTDGSKIFELIDTLEEALPSLHEATIAKQLITTLATTYCYLQNQELT